MKEEKKSRATAARKPDVKKAKTAAKKAPKTAAAPKEEQAAKPKTAKPRTRKAAATATVRDLMTGDVLVCMPQDNLAAAASKMWNADCGCLPVVEGDGSLVGWITDRDVCMAVGMQPSPAASILVAQVMNGPVRTCRDTADVLTALKAMSELQVRRLAVVDADEALVGVLSITDLVRAAQARSTANAPSKVEVLDTLRTLCEPYETVVPA